MQTWVLVRQHVWMKLCLIALLSVAGCSRVPNTFEVDVADVPAAVGVLAICGEVTPLARHRGMLRAVEPITCEGGGELRLQLGDERRATCPVGYVTPGAVQVFRYRLEDGRCEPVVETVASRP